MEMWPRLKVSSDRLMKPGIEPATPGLQGKGFIQYTMAAPLIWMQTDWNFNSISEFSFENINFEENQRRTKACKITQHA